MYLQITTKCNFSCEHCCYNCTMRGKHMDMNTFNQAYRFASERDPETIAIGGGEPTLHPEFFQILKICLNNFEYVWMATNGSQTRTMLRLADIMTDNDYDNQECQCGNPEYCSCSSDDLILSFGHLCVALSQDSWHDPIDQRIVNLWKKKANVHGRTPFEIRSVSQIISQGRAAKSGAGTTEHGCVCSDHVIKPDGNIKICGCQKAPIIGNVWDGISEEWNSKMFNSENFQDDRCYQSLRRKK